jgi:hypothetical protein
VYDPQLDRCWVLDTCDEWSEGGEDGTYASCPGPATVSVGLAAPTTTEDGGTAVVSVVLDAQPSATVTITFNSSDTTEGVISKSSLTFGIPDWNVVQTVTVTGVEDNDPTDDGNFTAYNFIVFEVSSSDAKFDEIPSSVDLLNSGPDGIGMLHHLPISAHPANQYFQLFFGSCLRALPLRTITTYNSASYLLSARILLSPIYYLPKGLFLNMCQPDIFAVNECASAPCLHGGTCIDASYSFICQCPIGWTGLICESGGHFTPSFLMRTRFCVVYSGDGSSICMQFASNLLPSKLCMP